MTEPTDAEIESAWVEATGSSILPYPDDMLAFARAVLAKWGQPPAVVGEPVAWLSTDSIGERYLCFTKPKDSDSALPLVFGDTTPQPQQPEGWRNKFAEAVYADLAAADTQDVPLEEYPARILKVLDSIVGHRHPTVIHWRNDAIQACIAIAYKYCRDPESFQYLKQDLQSLIFAAPKQGANRD